MIPEARLEQTDAGLVPHGSGWFVLNARDASWAHADGRGARCWLEGEADFPQVGVSLYVLEPGEPMGMYHWEAGQEDFLVLSGEAVLLVEGTERSLRQWDFVHCPSHTEHIIVGTGDRPCTIFAVGARVDQTGEAWGAYTVDELALRHGAGVVRETRDELEAYAHVPHRKEVRYRDDWLSA